MKAVTASFILGFFILLSTIAGVFTYKYASSTENYIPLDGGSINLGQIYREKATIKMDVIRYDADGTESTLVSITSTPDSAQDDLKNELQKIIRQFNSAKDEGQKIDLNTMSFKSGGEIRLSSSINYTTQYFPIFELSLDTKKVAFKADDANYTLLKTTLDSFSKETAPSIKKRLLYTKQ